MHLWPTGSWRIFITARNLPPLPSHSAGQGWTADNFSCLLLELANVSLHSLCAWFTAGVNYSWRFPSEHEWLWKEGNLKYWKTWPVLQTITDLTSGFQLTCTQIISLLDVAGCLHRGAGKFRRPSCFASLLGALSKLHIPHLLNSLFMQHSKIHHFLTYLGFVCL